MANNISPPEMASSGYNTTATYTTTTINYHTSLSSEPAGKVGVYATLIFSLMVVFSNGALLLIFLLKRDTRKHLSLVQAVIMINLLLEAIFALTLRLPTFTLTEDYIASVSVRLCHLMELVPATVMMVIQIYLPLITAEHLLKLISNPIWTPKRNKQIVAGLIGGTYITALIISFLPLTNALGDSESKWNTQCAGTLKYGHTAFVYTYSAIVALSVILTLVFSITVVIVLKRKISHQKSRTKRRKLKRGVVTCIALTVLLGIATVPFAISLQIAFTCKANVLPNKHLCDQIKPNLAYTALTIQKIAFTLFPIILLRLNTTMRRRVWLSLRRPKQTANIVTLSSANTSTDASSHSSTNKSSCSYHESKDATDAEGDLVIHLDMERQFPDEVIRRVYMQNKYRQNFLEIDILSVISEASEPGASTLQRTNSADSSYRSTHLSNNNSDVIAAFVETLSRHSSIKRSYSNASYISNEVAT